jgi:hypothetical protein
MAAIYAVSGGTTQVKKVVVGVPVKRVTSGVFNISNINGVDTTGALNGAILTYDASQAKWTAKNSLEEQNINGGQY